MTYQMAYKLTISLARHFPLNINGFLDFNISTGNLFYRLIESWKQFMYNVNLDVSSHVILIVIAIAKFPNVYKGY